MAYYAIKPNEHEDFYVLMDTTIADMWFFAGTKEELLKNREEDAALKARRHWNQELMRADSLGSSSYRGEGFFDQELTHIGDGKYVLRDDFKKYVDLTADGASPEDLAAANALIVKEDFVD